jgi:hypothetical protein
MTPDQVAASPAPALAPLPPFPVRLVFPDVDAAILAAEEDAAEATRAPLPWPSYMRRILRSRNAAQL